MIKKISEKITKHSILIKKITSSFNILNGAFKISLALLSKSILLFIYSFYNLSMGIAKRISVRKKEKNKYQTYFLVGIVILISSISYILYSDYVCFHGSPAIYKEYTATGIAIIALFNIINAIFGIIKAKKTDNIQLEAIKLTNLASAFISVSLTQTAILSFIGKNDFFLSSVSNFNGILFGILSASIGIYMILNTLKKLKA